MDEGAATGRRAQSQGIHPSRYNSIPFLFPSLLFSPLCRAVLCPSGRLLAAALGSRQARQGKGKAKASRRHHTNQRATGKQRNNTQTRQADRGRERRKGEDARETWQLEGEEDARAWCLGSCGRDSARAHPRRSLLKWWRFAQALCFARANASCTTITYTRPLPPRACAARVPLPLRAGVALRARPFVRPPCRGVRPSLSPSFIRHGFVAGGCTRWKGHAACAAAAATGAGEESAAARGGLALAP
jgi:hypothetical protein